MNILASSAAWSLDLAFFAILLIGLAVGAGRGFVKGICKIAGTIFSIVVAVSFCAPLSNSMEKWFGLTTALEKAIHQPGAGWVSLVIAFIALVVVVKLGAWLLGKVGSALVKKFKPMKTIDRFLGGLLGLLEAFFIILLLLAIFKWVNSETVNEFINASTIVKRVYEWNWFEWAMSLPFVKGESEGACLTAFLHE